MFTIGGAAVAAFTITGSGFGAGLVSDVEDPWYTKGGFKYRE